jgi:hypothetical protein
MTTVAQQAERHIAGSDFLFAWNARQIFDRCFYCGLLFAGKDCLTQKTVEHVYGRRFYPQAIVNACRGCNGAKHGFSVSAFRAWRRGQLYCDKIVGSTLPNTFDDGRLLTKFKWLMKEMEKKNAEIIKKHLGSKRLLGRLRIIAVMAQRSAAR